VDGIYTGLAVIFGFGMWAVWGRDHGIQFFAGFLTEWSLSVDNLFVMLIIITTFAVPRHYQQNVLLAGIGVAIVLRGIFIALGAAIIENFSWVFYVFGAFLIYSGWKLARSGGGGRGVRGDVIIRVVRAILPMTTRYAEGRCWWWNTAGA